MLEYIYLALFCYSIGLISGVSLILAILLRVMKGLGLKMRPKP